MPQFEIYYTVKHVNIVKHVNTKHENNEILL